MLLNTAVLPAECHSPWASCSRFCFCRYNNLVGGLQVGFEPHYRAMSKVDVALGYMNNDIICHIKLCVLFCYVICGDLISKVDNSEFNLTHE